MSKRVTVICVVMVVSFLLSSAHAQTQGTENGEWRYIGGDVWHTRYSPLDQVTADNFEDLAKHPLSDRLEMNFLFWLMQVMDFDMTNIDPQHRNLIVKTESNNFQLFSAYNTNLSVLTYL